VASRPVNTWRSRSSPPPDKRQVRTAPSPYPPDWSWWSVKGRQTLISLVHLPVSLTGPASSGSTDASQRCQGCSHPPRHLPDQAAPSFTQPLRRPGGEGLSPPLDFGRLVAHVGLGPVDTTKHPQDLLPPVPRHRSDRRSKPGPGHARSLMAGLHWPDIPPAVRDPSTPPGPSVYQRSCPAPVVIRGDPCQRLEPRHDRDPVLAHHDDTPTSPTSSVAPIRVPAQLLVAMPPLECGGSGPCRSPRRTLRTRRREDSGPAPHHREQPEIPGKRRSSKSTPRC
jgi:hypothetical protein